MAVMSDLKIGVCPGNAPVEEVAHRIIALHDLGKLPRFNEQRRNLKKNTDGFDNCHMIAIGFMTDVSLADVAKGWSWVEGRCRRPDGSSFRHSWIEYERCVYDATVGMVMERSAYRKQRGVRSPKSRDAKQFQKYMKGKYDGR